MKLKIITSSAIITLTIAIIIFYLNKNNTQDNDKISSFNQGSDMITRGDYQQAIEHYSELIKNKKTAASFYNRGIAYFKQNDYMKAEYDFSQAIKLDPNFSPAYLARGNAYSRLKDYKNAIKDYEKANSLGIKSALMQIEKIKNNQLD